jgi:hypothetical protein
MELVTDAVWRRGARGLNDVQCSPLRQARTHHAALLVEVVRMLCARGGARGFV